MASSIFVDPALGNPPVIKVGDFCYFLVGESDIAPDTFAFSTDDLECDGCAAPCACPGGLADSYAVAVAGGSIDQCWADGGSSFHITTSWSGQTRVVTAFSAGCEWQILASDSMGGTSPLIPWTSWLWAANSACEGTPTAGPDDHGDYLAVYLRLNSTLCQWELYSWCTNFGTPFNQPTILGIKRSGLTPKGAYSDGSVVS